MFDTFIFAQNGTNLTVTLRGLEPGRYHFYLYGHADPDVTGEQNSIFTLRSGTNRLGPLTQPRLHGWKASAPWQERYQFVVFRDVPVVGEPAGDHRSGARPEWRCGAERAANHFARHQPAALLATPAVASRRPTSRTCSFHRSYDGQVTDTEARFTVNFDVESLATNEISAHSSRATWRCIAAELPEDCASSAAPASTRLFCSAPGTYTVNARPRRQNHQGRAVEPDHSLARWPPSRPSPPKPPSAGHRDATAERHATRSKCRWRLAGVVRSCRRDDSSPIRRVSGFLGDGPPAVAALAEQDRRRSRASRSSPWTRGDSVQVTPTVIKYTTQFRYEILQAPVSKLAIALPATHALTTAPGRTNPRLVRSRPDGRPAAAHRRIHQAGREELHPHAALRATRRDHAADRHARPAATARRRTRIRHRSRSAPTTCRSRSNPRPACGRSTPPAGALAAYRFYAPAVQRSRARLKRIEPVAEAGRPRHGARSKKRACSSNTRSRSTSRRPASTRSNSRRSPASSWPTCAAKASTIGRSPMAN